MNGGALFGLVFVFSLIIFNYLPYTLNVKFKTPYWLSGLIICFLGPIVASTTGSFLLKEAKSEGSDGFGAGIAGALIALVIIANGVLYIIGSIVASIDRYFKQKNKEKKQTS